MARFFKCVVLLASVTLCLVVAVTNVGLASAQAGRDPSFVHVFSDGVWFLRWTESGGALSGQLQSVSVTPNLTLSSSNTSLSGVRSGVDVTLRLGGLLGNISYTGTLRGSTLVLNLPLQNGSMESIVFQPGTVDDYNSAVAKLRAQVGSAAVARQKAADQAAAAQQLAADLAARQRAVVRANAQERDSMVTVQTTSAQLKSDTNFGPALDKFSTDWAQMQRDYATLQADAAERPLTCTQLQGPVAYDLQGRHAYDLQGRLGYDSAGVFAYRSQVVTDAIASVVRAIQGTQQSFAILREAVAQNTAGTPGPTFNESQVQSVVAAAAQQVTDSNTAISAAEAAKDHILDEAKILYASAQDFVGHLTCTQ